MSKRTPLVVPVEGTATLVRHFMGRNGLFLPYILTLTPKPSQFLTQLNSQLSLIRHASYDSSLSAWPDLFGGVHFPDLGFQLLQRPAHQTSLRFVVNPPSLSANLRVDTHLCVEFQSRFHQNFQLHPGQSQPIPVERFQGKWNPFVSRSGSVSYVFKVPFHILLVSLVDPLSVTQTLQYLGTFFSSYADGHPSLSLAAPFIIFVYHSHQHDSLLLDPNCLEQYLRQMGVQTVIVHTVPLRDTIWPIETTEQLSSIAHFAMPALPGGSRVVLPTPSVPYLAPGGPMCERLCYPIVLSAPVHSTEYLIDLWLPLWTAIGPALYARSLGVVARLRQSPSLSPARRKLLANRVLDPPLGAKTESFMYLHPVSSSEVSVYRRIAASTPSVCLDMAAAGGPTARIEFFPPCRPYMHPILYYSHPQLLARCDQLSALLNAVRARLDKADLHRKLTVEALASDGFKCYSNLPSQTAAAEEALGDFTQSIKPQLDTVPLKGLPADAQSLPERIILRILVIDPLVGAIPTQKFSVVASADEKRALATVAPPGTTAPEVDLVAQKRWNDHCQRRFPNTLLSPEDCLREVLIYKTPPRASGGASAAVLSSNSTLPFSHIDMSGANSHELPSDVRCTRPDASGGGISHIAFAQAHPHPGYPSTESGSARYRSAEGHIANLGSCPALRVCSSTQRFPLLPPVGLHSQDLALSPYLNLMDFSDDTVSAQPPRGAAYTRNPQCASATLQSFLRAHITNDEVLPPDLSVIRYDPLTYSISPPLSALPQMNSVDPLRDSSFERVSTSKLTSTTTTELDGNNIIRVYVHVIFEFVNSSMQQLHFAGLNPWHFDGIFTVGKCGAPSTRVMFKSYSSRIPIKSLLLFGKKVRERYFQLSPVDPNEPWTKEISSDSDDDCAVSPTFLPWAILQNLTSIQQSAPIGPMQMQTFAFMTAQEAVLNPWVTHHPDRTSPVQLEDGGTLVPPELLHSLDARKFVSEFIIPNLPPEHGHQRSNNALHSFVASNNNSTEVFRRILTTRVIPDLITLKLNALRAAYRHQVVYSAFNYHPSVF